jgi:hypothetical protein
MARTLLNLFTFYHDRAATLPGFGQLAAAALEAQVKNFYGRGTRNVLIIYL